ncbi:MAG: glycosyltransferase family 2 protein [Bacteroidales bacterium]|nr:glycosyltransferase family 2 protein [Bacteroidales bacterium]
MKTAVVILNWNGRALLERFLPSVAAFTQGDCKVYVADNASTDTSVAFVRQQYPDMEVLELDKNYGFAEGYNRALAQIEAEYYCLLNSDVEVEAQWTEAVTAYMDAHPEVAVCQPKLLSQLEKDRFEYAGAAGGFIDRYGYPFCRGRIFSTLEKDEGQYDTTSEVFWATGACMFVRAEVYRRLGGLDADFFAHMEEIDFCWRVRNAGYKVVCCPEAKVYHLGGATLPKSSSRKTFLNFRNNWLMLYKNLPGNRLFPVFLVRWIGDVTASFRFLLSTGWGDFHAVYRAHRAFFRLLPETRKKREKINHSRSTEGIYQGNLVFDYFLFGKKTYRQLSRSKRP